MSCCLCCLPKSGAKKDNTYKKIEAEEKTGSYGSTSDNQYIPPTPSAGVAPESQGHVNEAAADFDDIWAAFDVDGDGTIDVAETFDTLKRKAANLTEEKVDILVHMVTGGEPRMKQEDLKVLLDIADKCATFPQLEFLLTSDTNKDGKVSEVELQNLLGLNEDQTRQIMGEADKDEDGFLSIKEILIAFAG